MSATCPAKGCTRKILDYDIACPTHFRKLPWRIRTLLGRATLDAQAVEFRNTLAEATTWLATHDCGPASVNTDYGIPSVGDGGGAY